MLNIDIIAVGKMKNHVLSPLFEDYRKRLQGKLTLYELEAPTQDAQLARIGEKLNKQAALIVLDERGKNLSSRDFAAKLQYFQNQGQSHLQCVIGGADGLNEEIRDRADLVLSFGSLTWPHMMARVMLIEQLYRAQQILAGHPYHRD